MGRSFSRDLIRCVVVCAMIVACGESLYFMNDLSTPPTSKKKTTYYRDERTEYYYQQEVHDDIPMVIDTIQGDF